MNVNFWHQSDSLSCSFYQDKPQRLVDLQKAHWDPLLAWARQKYGIEILTFDSIFSKPQPAETYAKLDFVMTKFDPWEMTGKGIEHFCLSPYTYIDIKAMERATYTSKSFIIALALVTRHITVEQAALASTIEVSSQIKTWGEVEDCTWISLHARWTFN
jgi:ATP synthase F1 complex assembly factor 2